MAELNPRALGHRAALLVDHDHVDGYARIYVSQPARLQLVDELTHQAWFQKANSGDLVIVTKRGKPVAKLIPIAADSARLIGVLKDDLEVKGDILRTSVKWDAES